MANYISDIIGNNQVVSMAVVKQGGLRRTNNVSSLDFST